MPTHIASNAICAARHARRRFMPGRALALLIAICAAVLPAPRAAHAQAEELDPNILIDGLADEGMSDLLLHYAENELPDDPVLARRVEIAQYRLRYSNEQMPTDARHEALDNAIDATRQLISEFSEHNQRPVWQTNLAELLLTAHLQDRHQQARAFYEFGVPTAEQGQAYETAVVEALEAVNAADLRLFRLLGAGGLTDEERAAMRRSGTFERFFEEYGNRRTPFFLGIAAYHTALLPDAHPYFANLGQQENEHIPEQADSIADERRRLLERAVSELRPVINNESGTPVAEQARLISARAKVQQGRISEGVEELESLIEDATNQRNALIAKLGKAAALRQQGDYDAALSVIEEARDEDMSPDESLVQGSVLYLLLVIDAEHRTLLARAEQQSGDARDAAIANAYQPYVELLEDRDIEQGEQLRSYIYRRWQHSIADDAQLANHPPIVRLGIAQMERIEGERQAAQARSANRDVPQAALDKLDRAISIAASLQSESVPESVRASALFNQALAEYHKDPQSNRLTAATLFTDLAADMVSHPQADDAIANAVQLLRPLYRQNDTSEEAKEAYERAGRLLLDQYPTTSAADDERLYYTYYALQSQGQYEAAVEQYDKVVQDHPSYFEAQRERMYCLQQLYEQAQGDQARQQAAERVNTAAENLIEEASQVEGDNTRAETAKRAEAAATLVRAEMAAAAGDADNVRARLANFEEKFSGLTDLIRRAQVQRILALIEIGKQKQDDAADASGDAEQRELLDQAESLMNQAVAQAPPMSRDAAAVIGRVLEQLKTDIRLKDGELAEAEPQSKKDLLAESINQLAMVASQLSSKLVTWADGQDFTEAQMLPYRLIQAEALLMAGKPNEALKVTKPLYDRKKNDGSDEYRYRNNLDLLSAHGNVLFKIGMEQQKQEQGQATQTLIQAARIYDRIIRGLNEPYPDAWWNAWAGRLEINDALGQGTDAIAQRIRQLRRTDENLGGPPYQQRLQRLEDKYIR